MPTQPSGRAALASLAELCDRQAELSTPAHVAVMEAFNACVHVGLWATPPREATPREAINDLLVRTRSAFAALQEDVEKLDLKLACATVETLLEQAIAGQ